MTRHVIQVISHNFTWRNYDLKAFVTLLDLIRFMTWLELKLVIYNHSKSLAQFAMYDM